jgi:putative transposase
LEPVAIPLPARFTYLPEEAFREVRLVYNHKRKKYQWHLVIDDGQEPPEAPGDNAVSVDLGEIHPAVVSDHSQAVVFSVRELRAVIQYRNKRLAEITRLQSRCKKKSRRWWRLQRLKNEIRAYCERKIRDILHKVSRAVVAWAIERKAGLIVIGDVRDIGNGKRLARKSQQKISQWPHGRLRRYIRYKAAMAGIEVVLEGEAYTSQTCPDLECGHRHKAKGRNFKCPQCGLEAHRDVVGAANILSKYLHGLIGGICPQDVRFVQPYKIERKKYRELRSRSAQDTGHVGMPRRVAVSLAP